MQPHKMALVQLSKPLDKRADYIAVAMYNTNCQPVPTFQTVEYRKFDMNSSKILPECVVNEQCLSPVSALIAQSGR